LAFSIAEGVASSTTFLATDTQAVDDQQKVVDQAQTDVNQQQAVVDEKAKETNAAKDPQLF
jgi:hypothetical protein